ncbi:hypothetical protein BY996DRAFT_6416403 [Phakopsora pachyrhizi]|nr:hypothetical protein BY996DRAFT_6416403 [Phakopsora pachyrhizi]
MPDTSGASSPEANQSTVQKILRGAGWSFGTLNQTKSNSTVTRAVNPQALFIPSKQVKQLPLVIQYALPIVSIASVQSGILLNKSSRFMNSIAPHSASSRLIESPVLIGFTLGSKWFQFFIGFGRS